MKTIDIQSLARDNIRRLAHYSSAREEFSGTASVFLDANENPYGKRFNRYPDPLQKDLKARIASLKNLNADQVFLGNGSDEAIDLLIRAFCHPVDFVIIPEPTYGMYAVCAAINAVSVSRVPLTADFQLVVDRVLEVVNEFSKIVFLCSPNNPTGNLLDAQEIERLLKKFNGLVVIDEAYLEFSGRESWTEQLRKYQNLVVLQTFSKSWGLAGLRLGVCYAHPEIIGMINRIKAPYNINSVTQREALLAVAGGEETMRREVQAVCAERAFLRGSLTALPIVEKVFPSDANFLLVKFKEAKAVYGKLLKNGIVVRDRSEMPGCEGCLRITVGNTVENIRLLNALK